MQEMRFLFAHYYHVLPQSISQPDNINYITFIIKGYGVIGQCPALMQHPLSPTRHHHKTKSITKMEVEKLTGKQPSQQQSLVGKGSYVPGIKQSCKAVAAFYYDALSAPVKSDTIGY